MRKSHVWPANVNALSGISFFGGAYPIDLEQCVWTAMFYLLQNQIGTKHKVCSKLIAYRVVLKELDKVRNTFVTDELDEQLSRR